VGNLSPMGEHVGGPREEGSSSGRRPTAGRDKTSSLRSLARRPEARLGAVVVLALAAGVIVWLVARGNDDASRNPTSARAVSAQQLAAVQASVRHPVYWAGAKPGFTYELTQTTDGRIYVRYLPSGVSIGANKPKYLTIGTYPLKNALASVRAIAKRLRVTPMKLKGGGIAVQDTEHPTSVYFAAPGLDYQVEVYEPSPARALDLVRSGKLRPVTPVAGPLQSTSAEPTTASVQQLRALESEVRHPVYWVGPGSRITYELTRTSDGRIYVRYLPRGAEAGDPRRYTTVATYPVRNPVAAVKAIAKETGGRTVSVSAGGVAAVDGNHPTSVYVAHQGSNYQVEVFDPSAARALRLVSSGRVVPVR
jgi:hypothetical protein